MGVLDFLHRPNGNKDLKQQITSINQAPQTFSIKRDKENTTEVFGVRVVQKFRHRDGSVSCLIEAKIINVREGDAMLLASAVPICFEIPENRMDLARDIIERHTGIDGGLTLNRNNYNYIGRAFDTRDIRLQPPTAAVNAEVEKLNQRLLEEKINQRIQEARQIEADRIEQEETNKRLNAEADAKQKMWQQELSERVRKPYLRGGLYKGYGEMYDGINLNSGEILRVRNVTKVAKDASGRYIYTASVNSTPNNSDVELLDANINMPVVFTLPYRLNDIVNTKYDENTKEQLKMGILALLSAGIKDYENIYNKDNSRMYNLGGITKSGQLLSPNSPEISDVLKTKIMEVQQKYAIDQAEKRKTQKPVTPPYPGAPMPGQPNVANKQSNDLDR